MAKPTLSAIEYRDVSSLIEYSNNAKLHPEHQIDAIANSIAEFSFLDPVATDEQNVLLSGHGRLAAAKKLGLTQIPVIQVTGLSDAQKKAYRIASNKLNLKTGLDEQALTLELEALQDLGFDLELTGFDTSELDELLKQVTQEGEGSDEEKDDVPEPDEVEPRCKLGETWQLGKHKVAILDSTKPETLKYLFGDKKPHMIWADPPYGVDIVKIKEGLGGSDAAAKPFGSKDKRVPRGSVGASVACPVGIYAPIVGDNSVDTAVNSYKYCFNFAPEAVMFYWGGNYFAHELPATPCWIVWDKRDGMTSNNFADAELAWTNQSSPVRVFAHLWNGMIKASERGEKRVHPTQKPVKLFEYCASMYGKPGDLVFDPFLGSGMSLIGAESMKDNRTVYGCELSPIYADVCIQRWENFSGQTAQLINSM